MATEWYYAKGDQQHGPISSTQLLELGASGQLGPSDLVWAETLKDWVEAHTIKDLIPASVSKPVGPSPLRPHASPLRSLPPASEPAATPSTADAAPPESSQWYVQQDRNEFGPLPFSRLKVLAASGGLNPRDLLRAENTEVWIQACTLMGLAFSPRRPQASPKAAVDPATTEDDALAQLASARASNTTQARVPLRQLPFRHATLGRKPMMLAVTVVAVGLVASGIYYFSKTGGVFAGSKGKDRSTERIRWVMQQCGVKDQNAKERLSQIYAQTFQRQKKTYSEWGLSLIRQRGADKFDELPPSGKDWVIKFCQEAAAPWREGLEDSAEMVRVRAQCLAREGVTDPDIDLLEGHMICTAHWDGAVAGFMEVGIDIGGGD